MNEDIQKSAALLFNAAGVKLADQSLRKSEAIDFLKEALKLDPGDKTIRENINQVYLGIKLIVESD
jgi:hypothetical protein